MTDASEQTHFAVTYTEAELRDYGKLSTKRQARAEGNNTFFGMVFAVPLAIGFAVYGVFALGLIARAAVPPVLITAYVASVAGWLSYWLWIRSYYRKHARSVRNLGPWNFVFDATGIRYTSDTTEVRFAWRGVNTANDLGRVVLFTSGNNRIFIPARMFADDATRKGFVAGCAARIKAAADSA